MKKEYVELDCSVICFDNEDIVTASKLDGLGVGTGAEADIDYSTNF